MQISRDIRRTLILVLAIFAGSAVSISAEDGKLSRDFEHRHYATSMLLLQEYWESAKVGLMRQVLAQFEAAKSKEQDLRGFEWYYWNSRLNEALFTLKFEGGEIDCIDFHPDNVQLAAGGSKGVVQVWNSQTGALLHSIKTHVFGVPALRYSRDGKVLYVCAHDAEIEIYDSATAKKLGAFARGGGAFALTISSDGKRLATGGSTLNGSYGWDLDKKKLLFSFPSESECVIDLAFHPKDDVIATGSRNKLAHLWNGSTGKHLQAFYGHSDFINGVAFSPTGARLATASHDRTARVWNCATAECEFVAMGHTDRVECVTFEPSGARFATGSVDRTVRLWDSRTGRLLRTYKGHSAPVNCVRFDASGSRLVSAGKDGEIKFWDTGSREFTPGNISHNVTQKEYMTSVAVSPDFRTAATTNWGKSLRIWDIRSSAVLREIPGSEFAVSKIRYSPDSKSVAVTCNDDKIRLLDIASGKVEKTFAGHTAQATDLEFTQDGKTLASISSDKTILQWNVATGEEIRTIAAEAPYDAHISISADGKLIAGQNGDKVVSIWNAKTKKVIHKLEIGDTSSTMKFSPDGTRLAIIVWKTVVVFDTQTGKELFTYQAHQDNIYQLVFNRDGKRIASGDADHVVKVWDATSGDDLLTLKDNQSFITGLGFSDDGLQLAAADSDGGLCIWDTRMDAESQSFRGARRVLNAQTESRTKEQAVAALKKSALPEKLQSRAIELSAGVSENWQTLANASMAGSLLQDATPQLRHHSLEMAIVANQLSKGDDLALMALAAAQFRSGQVKEAAAACAMRKARGKRTEELWLEAMIQQSAGFPGVAQALWHFAKETEASDDPPATQALSRLRSEAESILFEKDPVAANRTKQEIKTSVEAAARILATPSTRNEARGKLKDTKYLSAVQKSTASIALDFLEEPSYEKFNNAAWNIVINPRESADSYAKAVKWAQVAVEKRGRVGEYLNTLGVAEYRAGNFADAAKTLKESDRLNVRFIGPQASDLAFLAMTHHRLGNKIEAEMALNRLREVIKGTRITETDKQFFQEATTLLEAKPK